MPDETVTGDARRRPRHRPDAHADGDGDADADPDADRDCDTHPDTRADCGRHRERDPDARPDVDRARRDPTLGRRYAIGDPGSFLGTKFSPNATAAGTRVEVGGTSEATLKPGSRAYGITPPAGKFVRWYPAARWAAGIK